MPERPGPARVQELAPQVFAYIQPDGSWHLDNMGFITGSDGVFAIDTASTEARTRRFLEAISEVTPAPVRTVVNTHHHGDHTNGNCLLPGATVVGHDLCRAMIQKIGINHFDGVFEPVDYGDLRINPPQLTFQDRLTLWADDLRVELSSVGFPAHTTNDIVAWIPERSVLFAGDLVVTGSTPFLLMGSIDGALRSLEVVQSFGAEKIVPGHGEVCDATALPPLRAYYEFVLEQAVAGRAAGLSPLEAARRVDLGGFSQLANPERLVGNLHRAYHELDGHPLGEWIDLRPAIRDMVELNGGRPLRTYA